MKEQTQISKGLLFSASVIIPSHNEEAYIRPCLEAVLGQKDVTKPLEVIVLANACTDRTVEMALKFKTAFTRRGWVLRILRTRVSGKINALNCAERAASGTSLIYLDADVVCGPYLVGQICKCLETDGPRYATGRLQVAVAESWATRRYADFWMGLPFMKSPAVGAGFFAVNRPGRRRWDEFPDIISDDTYVRLLFAPDERFEVPECYFWPMVEGFGNLVKVRRRQDAGVQEIRRLYPRHRKNEQVARPRMLKMLAKNPVNFIVYAAVSIAVRMARHDNHWTRGR